MMRGSHEKFIQLLDLGNYLGYYEQLRYL